MERCCFVTGLVLFLFTCVSFLDVYGQGCSPDPLNIPRFGKSCQYRCRCQNDRQCNNETGSCCSDDVRRSDCIYSNGCANGWMGPGCQYRNIAVIRNRRQSKQYGTGSFSGRSKYAVDGNRSTCTLTDITKGYGNQSWTIEFNQSYYIYGLVINIPSAHTGRFKSFKIYTLPDFDDENLNLVYQHPHSSGSTVMEIMLHAPVYTQCVRIELGIPNKTLSLCEVEIYAGRYLSYKKATEQSETYNQWESKNAVDGKFPTKTETDESGLEKTCSAVIGKDPKMWSVNLTKVYQITGVQIWARPNLIGQIKGIEVLTVHNSSSEESIYNDMPSRDIDNYLPKVIEKDSPKSCQSLRIQRPRTFTDAMTLCEVEIYGECDEGLCGWDCTEICQCSTITTGSYRKNGTCPYGCKDRWNGKNSRCDNECAKDKWGVRCHKICGHCINSSACDVRSGHCTAGCDIGWRNVFCNETCNNSTYGANCSLICGHCKDGAQCDVFSGNCTQGCDAGWTGRLCKETCKIGWYGQHCSESCGHCLENTTCHHVTGLCSHGCAAGYEGKTCKRECSGRTFGLNCTHMCGECKDGAACSAQTGICLNGCATGWLGHMCNMSCTDGKYGVNCSEECGRCDNAVCHHETGACPAGCLSGFVTPLCQTAKVSEPESPSVTFILMIVSIVFVVVIVIGIVSWVVVKRKRQRQEDRVNPKPVQTSPEKNKARGVNSNASALAVAKNTAPIISTKDTVNAESTAIIVSDLKHFCLDAMKDPNFIYQEFQNIPKGLLYATNKALGNRSKNRYKDMYPYDKNAVVLPLIPGDNDYINASYIDGYSEPKAYIAAQGAMETTVADIWRMIWSHKIAVVVMLTGCREMGKVKCIQYWPDSGQQEYGDTTVNLKKEDVYCDYTIRYFTVTNANSPGSIETKQFHFTGWPDKDVPDTVITLVQFWRLVVQGQGSDMRPWMVHCSAGIGRTGTFIALDYLYEQGKREKVVDVFKCVQKLREQRVNMVQTKEQYLFLHQAAKETLVPCGVISDAANFPQKWRSMTRLQPGTDCSDLYTEYLNLTEKSAEPTEENQYANVATFTTNDKYAGSRSRENLEKSRCPTILPVDQYRPRLIISVDGHNDYINAVKINTYCRNDRLVLTQTPLEATVVDCVRLIWQFNIRTVVLMDGITPEDDIIWPSEIGEINKIGPFSTKLMSASPGDRIISKVFELSYTESADKLIVCRFHLATDLDLSDSSTMLQLLADVQNWYHTTNTERPILVQCLDGATKSGIFCVLLSALERLKAERTIAIADTVRLARVARQQVIPTFDQYLFCWTVVKDYLESFELYGNIV